MTPDRSRTRHLRPLAPVLAGVIALLVASSIAVTASRAAFAATGIDTVALDATADGVGPLFELDALAPGDSATSCMVVDNLTPGGPGVLRVYSGGFEQSGSLSDHLLLTIEEGTGGSYGDCTGFVASGTIESGSLSEFAATHADYATGAGTRTPTTAHSTTYRITFTLDPDTPNDQQGEWVRGLSITWESQIPD